MRTGFLLFLLLTVAVAVAVALAAVENALYLIRSIRSIETKQRIDLFVMMCAWGEKKRAGCVLCACRKDRSIGRSFGRLLLLCHGRRDG